MRMPLPQTWAGSPQQVLEQLVRTFLAILCLLGGSGAAQQPARIAVADAIDSLVQQQIRSFNIPGLQIAVTSGESMLFSESYGSADLEDGRPVRRDTLFRIGSITKPITATAALILEQNQQLDL